MNIVNVARQLIELNYTFVEEKIKKRSHVNAVDKECQTLFYKKEVLNGVFKGLRYADFQSVCSAIYPKLIGSYEKEIENDLRAIVARKPSLIIDIGCAEGYYAVGLARLLPETTVIAADTSEDARRLCVQLGKFNDCANIQVTGAITADSLTDYNLDNALIICDCEGYEKHLFTTGNIRHLRNAFLIVETHDFIDPSISPYLENLFRDSHHIKIVSSVDDFQKAKYYNYPELGHLDFTIKKEILAEHRPAIMEWLILEPKTDD